MSSALPGTMDRRVSQRGRKRKGGGAKSSLGGAVPGSRANAELSEGNVGRISLVERLGANFPALLSVRSVIQGRGTNTSMKET